MTVIKLHTIKLLLPPLPTPHFLPTHICFSISSIKLSTTTSGLKPSLNVTHSVLLLPNLSCYHHFSGIPHPALIDILIRISAYHSSLESHSFFRRQFSLRFFLFRFLALFFFLYNTTNLRSSLIPIFPSFWSSEYV